MRMFGTHIHGYMMAVRHLDTLGFGMLVDEEKKHKTFGLAHYIDYFDLMVNSN